MPEAMEEVTIANYQYLPTFRAGITSHVTKATEELKLENFDENSMRTQGEFDDVSM